MPKNLIQKIFCGSEIRIIDPKKFIAEAVMSDETLDRYNEIIEVEGYRNTIKSFMKHPVLLSSHRYSGDLRSQIGEWKDVRIEGKKLVGNPQYYVDEGNPEADWAWKMVEKKIAAYSVGIIPIKVETMDWDKWEKLKEQGKKVARRRYKEQELIETSHVLIPANPSALQRSIKEGDDIEKDVAIFYFSNLDQIKGLGMSSSDGKDVEVSESDIEDKFLIKDPGLSVREWEVEEVKEVTEEEIRGVIPYVKMPCMSEDTAWDGPGEVAKATVDDLKKMCTYYAEPGDKKSDFKLPHHTASGYKTVKRGVMNAVARLSMTKMPSSAISGVKTHLGGHYKDFNMTPPWENKPKLWDEFIDSCEKEILTLTVENMKELFSEMELEEINDYMELLYLLNKGWDETDNQIMHRIKEPSLFSKFRYAILQKKSPKVFAIYGKLKTGTKWAIQALRFPKADGWTMEKAKAWVSAHPMKAFVEELEDADMEMMMMDSDAITEYLDQLATQLTLLQESVKPITDEIVTLEAVDYTVKIKELLDDEFKKLIDKLTELFNVKTIVPNESYIEKILETEVTASEEGTLSGEDLKSLMGALEGLKGVIEKK